MSFDEVLLKVGSWGRFQWIHIILISLAGFPIGLHSLANVFYMGPPDFACTQTGLQNYSVKQQKMLVSPLNSDGKYKTCHRYNLTYSEAYLTQHYNGTGPHPDVTNKTQAEECSQWAYDRSVFGYTAVEKVIVLSFHYFIFPLLSQLAANSCNGTFIQVMYISSTTENIINVWSGTQFIVST